MAYKGFVGSGTVGHFLSTTTLQLQFPADTYAGREATVEQPVGGATHYFSDGASWKPVPTLVLDSSGNITGLAGPSGTAGYVDAGLFGASPSATPAVNVAAIQAALNNGGLVTLNVPGVYQISSTLLISSNTQFSLGKNVTIKLASGSNCNLLRNKNAGITLASSVFVRASNIVTVTEPGHQRIAGDKVWVKNLATDTTFNGLVTVTSASTTTWTYASTGSNGSPTNFAYVTPANNTLAAANFVRATNVVTVTEVGHKRFAGDSIYIDGLATDTTFNGTYQIVSISGNTWTYNSTGSNGSPTGTAVVAGDNNISLSGGAWDGNAAGVTGGTPYTLYTASFGIIFGNVGHVFTSNTTHINQTKYAYWFYNASDINVDTAFFATLSDGVHFEGPSDRVAVANMFGKTADDVVAFTNVNGASGGTYSGFSSPSGLGNFGVCRVDGIYPSNSDAPTLIKVTGDSSTSMRSLSINDLKGSFSTIGATGISITDDGLGLVGMAINEVLIRNVYLTGGKNASRILYVGASGVIGKIRLENAYWTSAYLATYAIEVAAAAVNISRFELIGFKNDFNPLSTQMALWVNGGAISSLLLDGFDWKSNTSGSLLLVGNTSVVSDVDVCNGVATGAAAAGYLVLQNPSSTISRLKFSNITCRNNDSIFRQVDNTSTLTDVYINNVHCASTNFGMYTFTSCYIHANNFKTDSVSNNMFQIAGGTVRLNLKNCTTLTGRTILFNFGGSVVSYSNSDASFGVDMGNPAATLAGETPIAGDLHYNTNATTKGLYGYNGTTWTKLF